MVFAIAYTIFCLNSAVSTNITGCRSVMEQVEATGKVASLSSINEMDIGPRNPMGAECLNQSQMTTPDLALSPHR